MMLLRIYQVNIPAALFLDLMRGLLEGTRRFGWAGAARMIFFGVQPLVSPVCGRWAISRLHGNDYDDHCPDVFNAAGSHRGFDQLRPSWKPSWVEFKNSMHYAVRDYPGGIADFTTLRLDQLVLAAMASNVAIGLYVARATFRNDYARGRCDRGRADAGSGRVENRK